MKIKLWINIATFFAIALVIIFGRHDIAAAIRQMTHLNIWVLLLMIPAQALAFFCTASVYYYFFRATGIHLSRKVLFPASIELNFVNHIFPSGGVSGFSYLTMRLRPYGVSTAKSTLAQLVRFILGFVVFIGLLLVALILLALQDRASRFIILVAASLTFTILFATIALAYILGSRYRVHDFTQGLTRFLNKIIHVVRPKHPETIKLDRVEKTFNELHEDYVELKADSAKMKPVLLWSLLSDIAEILLIYIAFVAHGAWINPGALIIAYAIAVLAGLVAILPGGIGVYEPLMAAVLLSAGVPGSLAVSATLVSRVMALAMALGSGYVLYQRALRLDDGANSLQR